MASSVIVQKLRELILFLQLCCLFVIGNTVLRLSYAKKVVVKFMEIASGTILPEEMYWNALFTQAMMMALWEQGMLDIGKLASCGQTAPDPVLVDLATGKEENLLKIVDMERLQVLAFGSYTCPVFRKKFKGLQTMAEEFSQVADFSVIYIDEAHPADGWAFKDEVQITKHQNVEDRLKAAQKFSSVFCKQTSIRMFADSMKNEASMMYGVSAIRLYVISNETVVYEGGMGPTFYSLDEVRQAINNTNTSCVVHV